MARLESNNIMSVGLSTMVYAYEISTVLDGLSRHGAVMAFLYDEPNDFNIKCIRTSGNVYRLLRP